MYIFTTVRGKFIEMKEFKATKTLYSGTRVLIYRKNLEKKLGKIVIAWCSMGGSNPSEKIIQKK